MQRVIRTHRLDLVAATLGHIAAELEGPQALTALLGVPVPDGWPPGEYDRGALEFFRRQLEAGGPDVVGWYGWYALARGPAGMPARLVAAAGYMGPPAEGLVEIGYSVVAEARNRGYAREIVAALVAHAFEEPGVRAVVAHTAEDNAPSRRVLLGCGFEEVGPGPEPGLLRFRRQRPRQG